MEERLAKCVVWDLDNTIWDGTVLENDDVTLRPGIAALLDRLDSRGILNSVASRNDEKLALDRLSTLGIAEFFLTPQINFGPKAKSVRRVAENLNIGLDSIVFVDDDEFEREAVLAELPDVRVVDGRDSMALNKVLGLDREVASTPEARRRRPMYQEEQARAAAETSFEGAAPQFLASLELHYTIRRAGPQDLARAQELTARTNQLNSTGMVYSVEDLETFRSSATHELLVMQLQDRFGSYGIVGLALIELGDTAWTINMLLTSCRVMSRGAGGTFLAHIVERALQHGVGCRADFIHTGRNRLMYALFKFAGFRESGDADLLEFGNSSAPAVPPYASISADW